MSLIKKYICNICDIVYGPDDIALSFYKDHGIIKITGDVSIAENAGHVCLSCAKGIKECLE